jgi:parallel beta-helix repeat protein
MFGSYRIPDTVNNTISGNRIYSNGLVGIRLGESCENNFFTENDLINNGLNACFHYYRLYYKGHFYHNWWFRNYWSDWPGLIPRPIRGVIGSGILLYPWVIFDWFPRVEPHG